MYILQSVFFVTILSAIYAASFSGAMNTITKQLAIFLFPLLLTVNPLDLEKYRRNLLMGFAMGCTATVCYLYLDAMRVIRYENLSWKALFSLAFVNHNFSLPIDIHATYLSLLLVVALVYLIKRITLFPVKAYSPLSIICSLVLMAGLIQLSSKSVMIALMVIFNIAFPFCLADQKLKYRFLLSSLLVSAFLLFFIFRMGVFHERYLVDFKNDLFRSNEKSKEDWRRERWGASVELIKRSPIIGNGSGSEIPLLKEVYFERQMYSSYLKSLNAHNQFLSFLINSGIIGLLVYLGTLFWGFWKAIKRRDLMLLSFMILVTAVSFSEDLLDVNKGIFFYAFFFSFFILSKRKRLPDISAEAGNPEG